MKNKFYDITTPNLLVSILEKAGKANPIMFLETVNKNKPVKLTLRE